MRGLFWLLIPNLVAASACLSQESTFALPSHRPFQVLRVSLTNVQSLPPEAEAQLKDSLEGKTLQYLAPIRQSIVDAYQRYGFFDVKIAKLQFNEVGGG